MKLFDTAGLEEAEETYGEVEAWGLEDSMDETEAYAEIAALESELENIETHRGFAENFAGGLEASIDAEEKIAQSGEVTKATAQMAIQSTLTHAALIGDEDVSSVGLEDAESDPVAALEAATDDKRKILTKVMDGIKKIWAKVKAMTWKIILKVIEIVGRREKKIDNAIEAVKNSKIKADKFEVEKFFGENGEVKFAKGMVAQLVASGKKPEVDLAEIFKVAGEFDKKLLKVKDFEKFAKDFMTTVDGIALSKDGKESDDALAKRIVQISTAVQNIKDSIDLGLLDGESRKTVEAAEVVYLIKVGKTSLKTIVVGQGVPGFFQYATLSTIPGADKKIKVAETVPAKGDVAKALQLVKVINNDLKGDGKLIDGINKGMLKEFDEFSKTVAEGTADDNVIDQKAVSLAKKFFTSGPRIGFDIIMNQNATIDGVLAMTNLYLKLDSKKDKKEKKDK